MVQNPDDYLIVQGCSSLGCPFFKGYNQNVISLIEIPIGGKAHIAKVDGPLRSKLRQYGLHIGDAVRVLRRAPIGGPLLIEINGREIALGRAVAEKILVEAGCESH